jgi:hypothetical protein
MANFLKEHAALRVVLIAAAFLAGMTLVIAGWRMTGSMSGLMQMLAGLALLLAALWLYNIAYK